MNQQGSSDTTTMIAKNTQGTFGDVRIGVGNIWEEQYTEGGRTTNGLTAGLWIFIRNHSDQNQRVRVHPGQIVDVPGQCRIRVVSVEQAGVRLELTPAAAAPSR